MSEASRSHEALECGHCGHKSRMEIIAIASALDTHDDGDGPPFEAGTAYEVQRCPACKKEVLVAGAWHSGMEGPDDWHPKVVLPEPRDHLARRILEERQLDLECMKRAVEEAKKCVGEGGSLSARPKVAAVVLHEGKIVALGHRGELADGEHAEFTVLEGKCRNVVLTGATVYTTLEPCTTRNAPKIPCADRLISRKVARVVIGMLDPDERIRGRGILALRKANIRVDLFPPSLMMQLEELNRDFIHEREHAVRGTGANRTSMWQRLRRLIG